MSAFGLRCRINDLISRLVLEWSGHGLTRVMTRMTQADIPPVMSQLFHQLLAGHPCRDKRQDVHDDLEQEYP